MTLSVEAQALSLAAGILLGLGVGLIYDLFRILRCRVPARWLAVTLDLLFWVGTTVLLFLYAQAAEGGQVRLYLSLALFLGGVLYFRLFSPFVLRLGYRLADLLTRVLRFFLRPLRLFFAFGKKFLKKLKNIFSSRLRWYKISYTLGKVCRRSRHSPGSEGGQKDGQNQKGRDPDKNRHSRSAGLFCHRFAHPERPDRRRRG